MKNMKDFLTAIANGTMNEEVQAFAQAELDKRASANASAATKRNDKWYAENGALLEAVKELLNGASHPVTCAEIVASVNGIDSTSKATAVVKRIEGVRSVDVQVDKRIVKGYTL